MAGFDKWTVQNSVWNSFRKYLNASRMNIRSGFTSVVYVFVFAVQNTKCGRTLLLCMKKKTNKLKFVFGNRPTWCAPTHTHTHTQTYWSFSYLRGSFGFCFARSPRPAAGGWTEEKTTPGNGLGTGTSNGIGSRVSGDRSIFPGLTDGIPEIPGRCLNGRFVPTSDPRPCTKLLNNDVCAVNARAYIRTDDVPPSRISERQKDCFAANGCDDLRDRMGWKRRQTRRMTYGENHGKRLEWNEKK